MTLLTKFNLHKTYNKTDCIILRLYLGLNHSGLILLKQDNRKQIAVENSLWKPASPIDFGRLQVTGESMLTLINQPWLESKLTNWF